MCMGFLIHCGRKCILVFPDLPKINQEQPIRNALSPTTVTFNTSDDKVGPPWAAVYIMVSNAREYQNEKEQERPERPEGEDFKTKSADRSEAIKRVQISLVFYIFLADVLHIFCIFLQMYLIFCIVLADFLQIVCIVLADFSDVLHLSC